MSENDFRPVKVRCNALLGPVDELADCCTSPALWLDPAELAPLLDGRMVTRALTASATRVGRWRVPLWTAPQQAYETPAQRPALVTALRGLLASLQREPTEFELRAAAHECTVQADRIAAGRSRREDGDG